MCITAVIRQGEGMLPAEGSPPKVCQKQKKSRHSRGIQAIRQDGFFRDKAWKAWITDRAAMGSGREMSGQKTGSRKAAGE